MLKYFSVQNFKNTIAIILCFTDCQKKSSILGTIHFLILFRESAFLQHNCKYNIIHIDDMSAFWGSKTPLSTKKNPIKPSNLLKQMPLRSGKLSDWFLLLYPCKKFNRKKSNTITQKNKVKNFNPLNFKTNYIIIIYNIFLKLLNRENYALQNWIIRRNPFVSMLHYPMKWLILPP